MMILFFIIFSTNVFAERVKNTEKILESDSNDTTEAILEELESLDSLTLDQFQVKMIDLRKRSEQYLEKRNKECSGYYTSVIIDETGLEKKVKKRLTKQEKRLCMYSLVQFRIKFTKIAFKLRKNYLRKLHAKQMVGLEETQKKQILELEKLSRKYQ